MLIQSVGRYRSVELAADTCPIQIFICQHPHQFSDYCFQRHVSGLQYAEVIAESLAHFLSLHVTAFVSYLSSHDEDFFLRSILLQFCKEHFFEALGDAAYAEAFDDYGIIILENLRKKYRRYSRCKLQKKNFFVTSMSLKGRQCCFQGMGIYMQNILTANSTPTSERMF